MMISPSSLAITPFRARVLGGGGVATLPTGYAVEVKATGDRLAVTFPTWTVGASYSPTPNATAKVTLLVTSAGYTGTTLGTRVRTVVATKVARKPYPDNADQQETAVGSAVTTDLWLSEPIYDDDTIVLTVLTGWATDTNGGNEAAQTWENVGITNNSALTYVEARPVVDWNDVAVANYWDPSAGDFTVSVCAFHGHAQGGEGVAAVVFTFSDGSNTVTKTVTSSSLSSKYSRETSQGTRVVEYKATFTQSDVSGFTDGACTVDFDAYPFIGDATAIRTASDNINDITTLKVRLDEAGTYSPRYTVVNGTGSNVGTPTTHATKAAALADTSNTFGTAALAKAAIASFNNSRGHNNASNGVMVLPNSGSPYDISTMFGAPAADVAASDVWCTLEAETAGSVTISETASASARPRTAYWKFKGLNIQGDGASNLILFRFFGETEVAFDDCAVSNVNGYTFAFYQPSVIYGVNSSFTGVNLYAEGTTGRHCRLLRGCILDSCRLDTVKTVIGCDLTESVIGDPLTNQPNQNGLIFAFNKCEIDETGGNPCIKVGMAHDTRDVAIIQNIFWNSNASPSTAVAQICADGTQFIATNFVVTHNGGFDQRVNWFYNDNGSTAYLMKLIFCKYNVFETVNIKSDVFNHPVDGPNGGRIGNWYVVNGVGHVGNVYLTGSDSANFQHEFDGINTYNGQSTPATVTFTDAANGDFTLSSAGDLANRVSSGEAVLSYDLAGSARANDGTGAAGAYEA